MSISDKVALVTGGSGDIGERIARRLSAADVHVVLTYVGESEKAERLAAELNNDKHSAMAAHLDQRDPNSISKLHGIVKERFGRLDFLINNAAWNIGIPFNDLQSLNLETWDKVLETNLRGPYLLIRAFEAELRKSRGGIVNIASVAGWAPMGSSIAYAVGKAGLIHLTRCMAVALAPDVRTNCIAPGFVEGTRIGLAVPPKIRDLAKSLAVLGHTADMNDIAEQVLFFCGSRSVTGQTIAIDGGMPIGMV